MTSGYTPSKDEPDHEEILRALEQAVRDNHRLRELPAEEVAHQLVLGGYLREEPSAPSVAKALETMAAEEQAFKPDIPPEEPHRRE